jgi:hypothetical protein
VVGALAAAILVANASLPNAIEMLCSIAIIWANLAYLMVTFPLLVSSCRRCAAVRAVASAGPSLSRSGVTSAAYRHGSYFSLGRLGLPLNVIAVVWGLFVVTNISWPRTEIYGDHPWGRFAAPLATLALIGVGTAYYLLYQRRHIGIVPRHVAAETLDGSRMESNNRTVESYCVGRLAPGE